MTTTRKYFGTDGIRGTVGDPPITPDFVMKLGWAAGRVLGKGSSQSGHRSKVLIGKDTRVSGYMFESALEAGLSAAGVDIHLLGPMPTPGIAYLTRTFRAQAGIVISASHNPYNDNGIKFFGGDGMKLADETECAIERQLEGAYASICSRDLGKAHRVDDAAGRYVEFCKSTLTAGGGLSGMNIVLDCANGATYHVAPAVFMELGASVDSIGVAPNGFNINEECGAVSPESLRKRVLATGADLGIALDGDGDRLIMVDDKGEIVDGDEITYIVARHRAELGTLVGDTVVGTQMSNLGMEQAIRELGLGFERAKVGDRHIMEMLKQGGWTLGGETSGHIISLDLTTTGDGIISALQVLDAVCTSGRSLHDLKHGMKKFPQTLRNVRMEEHADVLTNDAVMKAVAVAEGELGGSGRILLRPSGTEPLIRVMVEGRDAEQVDRLADELAEAVGRALQPATAA
ncbi:MAG: phosphoglucosamine mutase [Gammaproteobacteria bacterium]|nr:phosphoglucosamine mutase [Gammaproteobacteria bacterium]